MSTLFTRCDHEPIWLQQALARPRPHCPLGLPAPGAVTTLSVLVSITGLVTRQLYHKCLIKVSDTHWEQSKLITGEKSSPRRKVRGRVRKRRQKSRVLAPEFPWRQIGQTWGWCPCSSWLRQIYLNVCTAPLYPNAAPTGSVTKDIATASINPPPTGLQLSLQGL